MGQNRSCEPSVDSLRLFTLGIQLPPSQPAAGARALRKPHVLLLSCSLTSQSAVVQIYSTNGKPGVKVQTL